MTVGVSISEEKFELVVEFDTRFDNVDCVGVLKVVPSVNVDAGEGHTRYQLKETDRASTKLTNIDYFPAGSKLNFNGGHIHSGFTQAQKRTSHRRCR